MVLDVGFAPILTKLWPQEGPKLKIFWPKLREKWLKPPIYEGLCFEIKFEFAVRTMNFIVLDKLHNGHSLKCVCSFCDKLIEMFF